MLITFFVHCTGHEVCSASPKTFKIRGTNLLLGCTIDDTPTLPILTAAFPNLLIGLGEHTWLPGTSLTVYLG
jgi:hypothetical protein